MHPSTFDFDTLGFKFLLQSLRVACPDKVEGVMWDAGPWPLRGIEKPNGGTTKAHTDHIDTPHRVRMSYFYAKQVAIELHGLIQIVCVEVPRAKTRDRKHDGLLESNAD